VAEKVRKARQQFARDALPAWRDRSIDDIGWANVRRLVDDVHRRAPIAANRDLARLKHFFGWAAKRRLIGASPCADIDKPAPETERERTLDEDQIRRFWSAAEAHGGAFRDVFRLQLVTGQRREEVLGMRWRELNLESRTWTIPAARAKNGRTHEVALSGLAVEILAERPRDQALVFPSVRPRRGNEGKTGDVGLPQGEGARRRGNGRRRRRAVPRLAPHRRDADGGDEDRGGGGRQGCPQPPGGERFRGVAAIYNRYEYRKEARAALEAWEARLRAIVESTAVAA